MNRGLYILTVGSFGITYYSFNKIKLAYQLSKLKKTEIKQLKASTSENVLIEGIVRPVQKKLKTIDGKDCVYQWIFLQKRMSTRGITCWEDVWQINNTEPFFVDDENSMVPVYLKSKSLLNADSLLNVNYYNPRKMSQDQIGNFSNCYNGSVEDFRFHDNELDRILFTRFFRIVELSINCDQSLLIYGPFQNMDNYKELTEQEPPFEIRTNYNCFLFNDLYHSPLILKYTNSDYYFSPAVLVSAFFFILSIFLVIIVFTYL